MYDPIDKLIFGFLAVRLGCMAVCSVIGTLALICAVLS